MKNSKFNERPVRALVLNVYLAGLIGLFACLLGSSYAHAQSDAYSIEVAVSDRSASEQKDAYVVAFRRILLNNSGDKTLLNRDEIRSGLNSAEEYVTGFTYRTPLPGTVISTQMPITDRVRSTGEATQLMMVSFDRNLVKALIESSSGRTNNDSEPAPIVRQSNSALVWMLIQDDGRDILISDPEARNVQSRAREIAGALGISLVFPSGDSVDKENIGIDDLLQMDVEKIALASERYEQSTVLIGNLFRNSTGRGWQGQWLRVSDGVETEGEHDSNTLDEALQQGMGALVNSGSADSSYRYGGPASSGTEGLIWVGSVSSLNDYASLIRFFEAVPNVGTVYPKEVGDTSMTFAVLPRSALRDVENAVPSQRWLRRSSPTIVEDAGGLAGSADLALEIDR